MIRKLAVILAVGLLAFTVACSSSSTNTTGSGSATGAAAANPAAACPTQNTKSFAKTRFVADVALAGGAFKRYIYTPAREGKFQKGAHGKTVALVKAAAAGAFVINRLGAAKDAAEANPTLCKYLATPIARFTSSVSGLMGKTKGGLGSISPGDVSNGDQLLSTLHNAASKGGAAFTDNQNANV